ncbi:MAG: trypsin-like peptidase domain-containing protein [Hyphomicrobiales bacterium]
MKLFYSVILFFICFVALSQEQEKSFETYFYDDFSTSDNRWSIVNKSYRYSYIKEGKLYDWNGYDEINSFNVIDLNNIKYQGAYKLSFSLSNLNNKKDIKTSVYYRDYDNSPFKSRSVDQIEWGVVWDYKDDQNYSTIIFRNKTHKIDPRFSIKENSLTEFKCVTFINGHENINLDWITHHSLNNYQIRNNIEVLCCSNFIDLTINGKNFGNIPLFNKRNTKFGIYIGSGSAVELYDMRVSYPSKCYFAEEILKKGNDAFDYGYHDKAIIYYDSCINMRCDLAEAYYRRAYAKMYQGAFKEAIFDCDQAIDMCEDGCEDYYFLRANCKIETQDTTLMSDLSHAGYKGYILSKQLMGQDVQINKQMEPETASGLVLSEKGYILTNEHVIRDKTSIWIDVLEENIKHSYRAQVIRVDDYADLAVLKIDDPRFKGFAQIPYLFSIIGTQVGDVVYSLGYPMIDMQGEEIKVTDGIISSKTGFQNDLRTYQITASIQPGNSGGPIINKSGMVIGIANSGIPDADNVGYAVKSSYIVNLIETISGVDVPNYPAYGLMSFSRKIKKLSEFVVLIRTR